MILRFIDSVFLDRKFQVHLNKKESKFKYFQYNLSRSPATPLISCIVYTIDIASTTSRKCMYVNDVGLA